MLSPLSFLRCEPPSWTRPFVEEPKDDHSVEGSGAADLPLPYAAIALGLLTIVGLGVQIFTLLCSPPPLASVIVLTTLWGLSALILILSRPRTAPVVVAIILAGIFFAQVALIASQWIALWPNILPIMGIVSAAVSLVALGIVLNMPLRDPAWPRQDISKPFTTPSNGFRSPEDNLTLWQWMTVSWMEPLIKMGNRRMLQDEDVWQLSYEFQHRQLHDTFRELKGSVVRRLIRANWIDLAILTLLTLVELAANCTAPLLLQRLLQSMEFLQVTKRPAITFALLILMLRLIAAQSGVFSLWFGRRCYERSRGEMITMLYEKSLNRKIIGAVNNEDSSSESEPEQENTEDLPRSDDEDNVDALENRPLLNGHTKKSIGIWGYLLKPFRHARNWKIAKSPQKPRDEPASKGKILNLMRNDVYEVAQRFWEFQKLVNKPLGLIVSISLVWQLIGWPCLIGVAVVIIAQVANAVLARVLVKVERSRRIATDIKLQETSQFVEAIRHLRWYGWHPKWLARILDARQKELNLRVITNALSVTIVFVNQLSSGMLPVAAFWAYTTLAGRELRIDVAFPALQLFTLVQQSLREIPGLITVMLNATVAMGRIEAFMKEPDKDDSKISSAGDTLELKDASFAWPGTQKIVLHNITLSFPVGLNVIFGPVAAGKTALLQAILGELDMRGGELIEPHEPIAYCSQTPWLQSMSIRDNILFGSVFDEVRYKKTLEVCALTTDLASFKHGDLSNIGENGIGLSGGQKARVALARAVYSNARILLLDDPLSALDQQTAEKIVAKCFNGEIMQGRTVLLVTHRTDLCEGIATQLIEILDGRAFVTKDASIPLDVSENSSISSKSAEDPEDIIDKSTEDAAVPDKFIEEEHRAHGGVQAAVYWEYAKAGKFIWWFLVIISCVIFRALAYANSWFLKEWGEAYDRDSTQIFTLQGIDIDGYSAHISSSPLSGVFDRFPNPAVNVKPWLIGFFTIVLLNAISVIGVDGFMIAVTYTAAKKMFKDIMQRVSGTTFRFYDVTPVGRLMNRLTSDVGTIDGNISTRLMEVAWQSIAWISSVIIIASITPIFVIFAVALSATFMFTFLHFLPTSQSLRRLEMVSLSPLLSNFGTLLDGLTTVRAFRAQHQFQSVVIAVTDAFQKMDHFYWSLQAWLMFRFDILSALSTLVLTLLSIYSGLTAGLTAFALVAAQRLVVSTHNLCKEYGQLQLDFVSVERVVELIHLEQEDPGTINPPAWWPSASSDIVFENVTIRYAPHLEPALSNISLTLKAGTNTAVIGRTGSGKSTLALALLATIPIESGRILIGGIDISAVNKQALRTRITFLAQEPVLFPGTLRHNLDPTDEHSDESCLAVISRVCGRYNWTLNTLIDTGGKNLSQGQRQLVGLARAVLRRSAIIIMDEATASIDQETSWEIQRVLREEMKESTVVTIAHRTSAVEGADYCVELAGGKVLRMGKPEEVRVGRVE